MPLITKFDVPANLIPNKDDVRQLPFVMFLLFKECESIFTQFPVLFSATVRRKKKATASPQIF